MLNIPSSVKALFQADGVHKNFRVHFPNGEMADITNDNVVQESVKFTESLCSQSTFKFGLAEASVLEFETVGIGNMYGMTIQASCEIDCSSLSAADKAAIAAGTWDGTWDSVNEVFAVPYGTFRVESCPRDHQSMAHRQVTAYSTIFKNMTEYPGLPKATLISKIYARQSALMATMFGTGLVVQGSAQARTTILDFGSGMFWDASGNQKYVRLVDYDDSQNRMVKFTEVLTAAQYDTIPAFISVNMPNYDAQAYEAFGVSVANALTSAGFDLTYNQARTRIFNSNEEALRHQCPWMFFPCVYAFVSDGNNNAYYGIIQQVKPDTLVPAVAAFIKRTNAAFWYNDEKYQPYRADFVCAAKFGVGNDARIAIGNDGSSPTQIIPLSSTGYLTTAPTVTAYGLTAYDEPIIINNTGTNTALYNKGDSQSESIVSLTNYTYTNSIDLIKLINGTLETKAMFLKTDRLGGFETIRLENLSPQSIVPENYSEAWWDEYDIAPIGKILLSYQDSTSGEIETALEIGTGASVYDMKDNEILKGTGRTLTEVSNFINQSFVPNIGAAYFTPIDFSYPCLPWLEAGDKITFQSADDSEEVESYLLRIETTGIQNIFSHAESDGGAILNKLIFHALGVSEWAEDTCASERQAYFHRIRSVRAGPGYVCK